MSDPTPVLLYDGVCALCNGTVRTILRSDPGGSMRFAALDSRTGRELLAAHPELAGVDSVVLIEGTRASVRSTAILRVARYLGGFWRLLLVGYLLPREIRDSLYDVVAYWRYRAFGKYDTCPIPPADQRQRFLP